MTIKQTQTILTVIFQANLSHPVVHLFLNLQVIVILSSLMRQIKTPYTLLPVSYFGPYPNPITLVR